MGILFFTILIIATVALLGIEIESAYADSNAAAIAYRSNTSSGLDFPKYREWNPSTLAWGSEVELPTAGSPVRFAWLEFSAISAKRVVVTLSDDGFLDSYVCDNACTTAGSWTVTNDIADLWMTAPTGAQRPFDMKFEKTSGDLILVYDKVSSSGTQDLFYRVMPNTATSFGAEGSIDDTTATATDTVYSFIRMATKFSTGSDSIGMIALDQTSSNSIAFVWDGNNWGNQHELTATASTGTEEVIGIDWETSSGNLVIVSGEGTSMRFNRFTTTWETSATFGTWDIGNINWVVLHANPVSSSNELFVVAVGDLGDMDSAYWNGSAWTDHIEHDAAVDSDAARIVDFSWSGDSSAGILIWATANGQLDFKRFTAPNTFSGQLFFAESGTHPWVQLASPPNPTAGDAVSALGATLDSTFDLGGIRWDDGSANAVSTGDGGITTDTTVSTYESYKISWQQSRTIIRVFTETLSTTDAFNTGFVKALSDTLTLVDDVVLSFTKVITEALPFVDTVVKTYSKPLTETISLSDTLTVTAQIIRNLNESLVFTDTNVRAFSRKLDETLTLSDAANARTSVKNLAETLTISDALVKSSTMKVTETLALADIVNPRITLKNLEEILTVTDTFAKSTTKILSETLTLADTVGAKITTKSLQETLGLSDTLVKIQEKNLSETLELSDTVNARIIVKHLSETLAVADAGTKSINKILSETLTLADVVNPRITVKGLQESIALADATNASIILKNLSETLTVSDAITKTTVRSLSEALTLSDTLNARITVKNLAETLTLSDTMHARITIKNLAEILTLSDGATAPLALIKNLLETFTLSDTVNARITGKGPSEILGLSDTVNARIIVKNLAETIGLADIFEIISDNHLNLAETIGLGDTITTSGITSNTRMEAMNLSDEVGLTLSTPCPFALPIPISCNFLGGLGTIGGGTITFSEVTTSDTVSVVASDTVSVTTSTVTEPPPNGLTIVGLGGSTIALDITTTVAFTGTVQICVTYDDTGLDPKQEAILQLQHFVGGTWVDITTSLDNASNTICGLTDSLSPFAVMVGQVEIGGSNRERPRYEISDVLPPIITEHYIKPEQVFAGDEIVVTAKIADDVGVAEAKILYFTNLKVGPPEFHQVSMEKYNAEWWRGTILGSDVNTDGLSYWIFTEDHGHNIAQSLLQKVDVQQAPSVPEPKPSQKNLPAHVLEAIKSKVVEPVEKLEVISINNGNEITTFTDKIIIRNIGNRTVDNIRVMLSPEISKSFKLSDPAIKSIEPNTNVTITLELNGSPNRDMLGGLAGYNGQLMVMAEHLSPILLPVNIGAERSDYVSGYMDKLAGMVEQRYNKISLLNSILTKQSKEQHNYEVTTSDGDKVITSPSDEIVIKNLSDKELKNVRIYVSNAGQIFLLEQNNIRSLEPNGQVSIKLTPKMDSGKYSPKDIKGELLIVPANDRPIQIPIDIVRKERRDSADEFEVRTLYGNGIFTAQDKIIIKNLGNRTLDSVRLMLSSDLARVLVLSNDSFRHIAPNSEAVVDLKFREDVGEHKVGIQYNYEGELTIVSEHHRAKVIPIKIEWNELSSDHFLIYSRNTEADIDKAKELITFLESNYQNTTSRLGEMNTKTRIYMTSTLEEFRILADSGHSHYVFSDDVIFVCDCSDDVKSLAMKEFVYRITFNKYPNYSNQQKFMLDGENWLMDGITNYIAANMTNAQGIVKSQIEAFKEKPTSFVWYGEGTPEQYGATYTFFDYLHEKYGENVIDRTLYYLGSGMISNTRCDTLEDCALLRAVYDVSGLDMKNKRYTIDVETLVSEWEDYAVENYSVTIPKPD